MISTSSSSSMNSTADSSVSLHGGRQAHRFVGAGSTHVGELLALDRVDDQVVVAAVNADDHAFVQLVAGQHEHAAAIFQVPQRVGHGFAVFRRNQHAVVAARHVGLDRPVVIEHVRHDAGAARHGHEFGLEADQTARRNAVFQTRTRPWPSDCMSCSSPRRRPSSSIIAPWLVIFQVYGQHLVRLAFLAVDLAVHHARLADAPSRNLHDACFPAGWSGAIRRDRPAGTRRCSAVSSTRNATLISNSLFRRSRIWRLVTNLPSCARQRRSVHHEVHGQRRLVHLEHGQSLRLVHVGQS